MSHLPCPNCGAEVENQFGFGMLTCPSCNHLFMMDQGAPSDSPLPEAPKEMAPMEMPPMTDQFVDVIPAAPSADGETFNDVREFGNTEIPASGSGALFYDLEISGIDTPESRKELEKILGDKRLELPPSGLMPKIKNGVLSLKQVHPVKAAVLVGELKSTHLKVKWTTDQMIKLLLFFCLLFGGFKAFASDWDRHEASLKDYSIKINNFQDDIRELAAKKKAEADPKVRAELLESIKKKYAELVNAHKEMLKEIEHVRFEHPEKGDKAERKYKHLKVKSLEELENDTTLDGQMSRIKRKAEDRYQK